MTFKTVTALLLFSFSTVRAQDAADSKGKNVFFGLYQGDAVGPINSRGYSIFYGTGHADALWQPRIGLTFLSGEQSKGNTWVKSYRFFSELITLEYALELCAIRRRNLQYCPFIPSVGVARRRIGARVNDNSESPRVIAGQTSATTLGTVVELEQRLKFSYFSLGVRFHGVFYPGRRLRTEDTFPDDATPEDKRISEKALHGIHNQNSVLSLRLYAGFVF